MKLKTARQVKSGGEFCKATYQIATARHCSTHEIIGEATNIIRRERKRQRRNSWN